MKIISWKESLVSFKESKYNLSPSNLCDFGISVLDDALIKIMPKEFIVIGADSGVGKSELCLKIALHNAIKGKKVALYFIEGGDEEAIARILWDMMCQKYFSRSSQGIDMDYRKWRLGLLNHNEELLALEDECEIIMDKLLGENLKLYSYTKGFKLEDLVDSLGYFLTPNENPEDLLNYKYNVDLIIIDHLQYFTLMNQKNELNEMTEILKKINDITHFNKIPVILISHLRKKEKDRGLPGQEDFYGTSNIAKIATTAITLASGVPDKESNKYPTYFRFVKTRTKISPSYAIKCYFDVSQGKYDEAYTVHFVNKLDEEVKNLPKWARNFKYGGYVNE